MAATVLRPSLRGGAELRRTAAVLRAAGREDLLRGVNKAVKAEAQPTLKDLKASARNVTITGERTTAKRKFLHKVRQKHLRERMAEATVVEVRTAGKTARVSFHTVSTRMGSAEKLPRYIDLGERAGRDGWRHPIMGRRTRWAASKGESWFWPPIKEHLPAFRERISAVLDEIVTKVEAS